MHFLILVNPSLEWILNFNHVVNAENHVVNQLSHFTHQDYESGPDTEICEVIWNRIPQSRRIELIVDNG